MDHSTRARIARLVREDISLEPYDPRWPGMFLAEQAALRRLLGAEILGRVEHIGSTAVPGLMAKPIIDVVAELKNPGQLNSIVVPALEEAGYEYLWRTDVDPPYAWFIKRGAGGRRSHHIHLVETDSTLWDRLLFRDYLRENTAIAEAYASLKRELASRHPRNRAAYTRAKSGFIVEHTEKARRFYGAG